MYRRSHCSPANARGTQPGAPRRSFVAAAGLTALALVLVFATAFTAAEPTRVRVVQPSSDNISALIRDLGDVSYEKRLAAMRSLAAIGMPARDALEDAANGEDIEVALRAKTLLTTLSRLLFSGAEVRLSATKTKIRWDEPFDLILEVQSSARFATRVPFSLEDGTDGGDDSDARQVGDMLDLAEWMQVRRADGREVSLKVDDIADDPAVLSAVQDRLSGGPVSTLEPARTARITGSRANRGWARFPLLDAGEYTFVFDYVPQWEDEVLEQDRIGRVRSNEVTVIVTQGAPAEVSRGGREASVTLDRDDDMFVANIVNHNDQEMIVNTNYGPAPPLAQGHWVLEQSDRQIKIPVGEPGPIRWGDFRAVALLSVPPGETAKLASIDLKELRDRAKEKGIRGTWTLHFGYANLCDRRWQQMQGSTLEAEGDEVPDVLKEPLSRRLLSARHASRRETIDLGD